MTESLITVLDTPALDSQGADLVKSAHALNVTDATSFTEAAGFARLVKAYLAEVDAFMAPICEQSHRAWKLTVAKRDGLKAHAIEAEKIVKGRMAAWEQEQARLRREAEVIMHRERERLEAQERERVAAERLRLQREAEERQLAEAMAKEAAGDVQAMEKILAAPVATPTIAPRPVFVPPVAVQAAPKVEGVSFREAWDFEVTDASQIPREYLVPDLVAIRKVVQALKGNTRIPGIRAFTKPVTAVRA